MDRITIKQLEGLVDHLNTIAKTPKATYTKVDGKFIGNIGNYHLDGAYGGYQLVQLVNESGGVRNVLSTGFVSKRELYNAIRIFMAGMTEDPKNGINAR